MRIQCNLIKNVFCCSIFILSHADPNFCCLEVCYLKLPRLPNSQNTVFYIVLLSHAYRCRNRQFLRGVKNILPEFPKIFQKNLYVENFPLQIFCSCWLLIYSHTLKHEVTRNTLLILYTVYLFKVFSIT